MDLKQLVYKPENNQYFGPNKPVQTIVLDQKDFGRGCIAYLERNSFKYGFTPKGRGIYKTSRELVLEVWEYIEGLPTLLHRVTLPKARREAKHIFREYVWDGNGNMMGDL